MEWLSTIFPENRVTGKITESATFSNKRRANIHHNQRARKTLTTAGREGATLQNRYALYRPVLPLYYVSHGTCRYEAQCPRANRSRVTHEATIGSGHLHSSAKARICSGFTTYLRH
jgi:hypothetical protein